MKDTDTIILVFYLLLFFLISLNSCYSGDNFSFVIQDKKHKQLKESSEVFLNDSVYVQKIGDIEKSSYFLVESDCELENIYSVERKKLKLSESYQFFEFLSKSLIYDLMTEDHKKMNCHLSFKLHNQKSELLSEKSLSLSFKKSPGAIHLSQSIDEYHESLDDLNYPLVNSSDLSHKKALLIPNNAKKNLIFCEKAIFYPSREKQVKNRSLDFSFFSFDRASYDLNRYKKDHSLYQKPLQSCMFFSLSSENTVLAYSNPFPFLFKKALIDHQSDYKIHLSKEKIHLHRTKLENPHSFPIFFKIDPVDFIKLDFFFRPHHQSDRIDIQKNSSVHYDLKGLEKTEDPFIVKLDPFKKASIHFFSYLENPFVLDFKDEIKEIKIRSNQVHSRFIHQIQSLPKAYHSDDPFISIHKIRIFPYPED